MSIKRTSIDFTIENTIRYAGDTAMIAAIVHPVESASRNTNCAFHCTDGTVVFCRNCRTIHPFMITEIAALDVRRNRYTSGSKSTITPCIEYRLPALTDWKTKVKVDGM